MEIYCARYVLKSNLDGELINWFEFEKQDGDKWEKTDYGYFYPNGYASERAEDFIQINDCLNHIINEKFFDRKLTKEELKELEIKMKKECIVVLEKKKESLIKSLDKQINFIKGEIDNESTKS